MSVFDILKGIASIVGLMLGIAFIYPLANGGWLLLLRSLQATGRFMHGLFHNPRQAVVDASFLTQLVLLPFWLVWEQWHQWRRRPEEARQALLQLKRDLMQKSEATDLFAKERGTSTLSFP